MSAPSKSHVNARYDAATKAFRRLSSSLLAAKRPGFSLSLLGVSPEDVGRYVRTDARNLAERMSRISRRAARMIAKANA